MVTKRTKWIGETRTGNSPRYIPCRAFDSVEEAHRWIDPRDRSDAGAVPRQRWCDYRIRRVSPGSPAAIRADMAEMLHQDGLAIDRLCAETAREWMS